MRARTKSRQKASAEGTPTLETKVAETVALRPALKVHVLGPGVGESIIIEFPSGKCGVIDCYQRKDKSCLGTLDFLQKKKITSLLFFCHTHPHEDHYRGAHLLIEEYRGKIEHIWRHPGFSQKDLKTRQNLENNARLAAKIKGESEDDAEALELEDEYTKLIQAIKKEKSGMPRENYRRISGATVLLQESDFVVSALAPTGDDIDFIEDRLTKLDVNDGYVIYSDEEGSFLNRLSVVLQIQFGDAQIFLLGDAQGESYHLHQRVRNCSVVKAAHHGSHNGLGVRHITGKNCCYGVDHVLVTPYTRSRLPRPEMLEKYQDNCANVHVTALIDPIEGPITSVPGLASGESVSTDHGWVSLEISTNGSVKRC